MPTETPTKQRQYIRGNREHYQSLQKASHAKRIHRYIDVEIQAEPGVPLPKRTRETDAGYDIAVRHDVIIRVGETVTEKTGLRLNCPPGYYFQTYTRSSLLGEGLSCEISTIDATYTGELQLILRNNGAKGPITLRSGDRVAQLLFLPQIHASFVTVRNFTLPPDARGEKGFGSSGKQ